MKNQLKIGIVLSYINMALNVIIQLSYTPIMIRLLGQSEYGLYNLVSSVVSYLSLFSLGFSGAYLRFYNRAKIEGEKKEAQLNGTFFLSFCVMASMALISGLILAQFTDVIFGDKLSLDELGKAKTLMIILVINLSISLLSSFFDSVISAYERFLIQRLLTILATVFNPIICLPLLLLGYGSVEIVLITTFITLAKFIADIIFCFRVLKLKLTLQNFDVNLIKEIMVFSGYIFLNMVIDQINWNVDKYILGRTSGTEGVAIYGVGALINSLVMTFSTSISSVFSPRIHSIANGAKENMSKEFTDLFVKVGRIQFIVLGLVVSGFFFFGKFFVTDVYAGKEYYDAYYVALLLIIPAMVPYIQNLGLEIQRSVNKHQVRSVAYAVMATFNVILSIPLAKSLGPIGAAIGTSISLFFGNIIFMNIYYHKKLEIDVIRFWKNIGRISLGMVPAFLGGVVYMLLDIPAKLSYFIICIMIYTLIYCVSIYLIGMNSQEKELVKDVFKKLCIIR
ncbi:MAG: polysaccharide biosynthesis protein [Lachnospiraceae bacterium]|nr:polysaccharide biosynthesis protein [Lachnospiraceae bacterium]